MGTIAQRVLVGVAEQMELSGEHSNPPLVRDGIAVTGCPLDGNKQVSLGFRDAKDMGDFQRVGTGLEKQICPRGE